MRADSAEKSVEMELAVRCTRSSYTVGSDVYSSWEAGEHLVREEKWRLYIEDFFQNDMAMYGLYSSWGKHFRIKYITDQKVTEK